MASWRPREYDIFLLGKTGTGKSATGNSILQTAKERETIFKTGSGAQSVTNNIQREFAIIEGHVVKVIDGPGLAENRLDPGEADRKAYNDMVEAMTICGEGFHALALVLRFGERFTKENRACLELLKGFFGKSFMRHHGVVIMTHGDLFERSMIEEGTPEKTFEEWCRCQEGELLELFRECNFRVVLFNNRIRRVSRQRKQLFRTIDQLGENRYTNDIFREIEKAREEEIQGKQDYQYRTEVIKECSILNQRLQEILSTDSKNYEDIMGALENAQMEANCLLQNIACSGQGSERVEDLRREVFAILEIAQTCKREVEFAERKKREMDECIRKNRRRELRDREAEVLRQLREVENSKMELAEMAKRFEESRKKDKEKGKSKFLNVLGTIVRGAICIFKVFL